MTPPRQDAATISPSATNCPGNEDSLRGSISGITMKSLGNRVAQAHGSGAKGNLEDEAAFPLSTASWFFLDAVDMMLPADTKVIVGFGDSITDGTASTMNG